MGMEQSANSGRRPEKAQTKDLGGGTWDIKLEIQHNVSKTLGKPKYKI